MAGQDILAEGAISLTAASRHLPPIDGTQVSPSTVWRWCRRGVDGVVLDHAMIGRRVVTSRAALARFAAQLAENAAQRAIAPPIADPTPTRTGNRRQRDVAAASKKLAAAGI